MAKGAILVWHYALQFYLIDIPGAYSRPKIDRWSAYFVISRKWIGGGPRGYGITPIGRKALEV